MSINGISGNVSTPSASMTPAAVIPPKPEATATPQSQPYTVKLTGTALAKSLKLAGQNPAQIALKMGIDVKTVDQYLSIKVASATPAAVATPAPAPTPAPEAKQAATTAPATSAEEAKEPAKEKASEAVRGKK
ncbi:MAG: hypothetical protein M0T70_16655 [Geobacteraceae bacterium]|nr:hypothetical protein [Geobacteraceae bacterium]